MYQGLNADRMLIYVIGDVGRSVPSIGCRLIGIGRAATQFYGGGVEPPLIAAGRRHAHLHRHQRVEQAI
jgi:hypothetical protein